MCSLVVDWPRTILAFASNELCGEECVWKRVFDEKKLYDKKEELDGGKWFDGEEIWNFVLYARSIVMRK